MEEDSTSWNFGTTQGVSGDSSSLPVDLEEHGSLPSHSSTHTHSVPPIPKKSRKTPSNQSVSWEHFEKVLPIDPDEPKARCKHCDKLFNCHYKNGTSSMNHHLYYTCEKSPIYRKRPGKSKSSSGSRDVEGKACSPSSQGLVNYDAEKLRVSTAKFFIRCELPFRLVEHEGLIEYVADLEPRFILPSRTTLKRDCMKLYDEEKIQLKKLLEGQRICLTTDTWTSVQNVNYMCITAHFIDCSWRLHKKILKFCQIPNCRGKTIGRMLNLGLLDWDINKILTITVDNASSNDVGIDYMKRRIIDSDSTILNGEFLHMRCAAHILNLIVNDGLEDVKHLISTIREAIKYVKSSPSRFFKFKACALEENISGRMLCTDVSTRWNSTYLMLSTAIKHKKAFERYNMYVDHDFVNPSSDDWKKAQIFVELLKIFYDVTLNISGSLYVTANVYFQELCTIEDTINDMCTSEDSITRTMGKNMKEKCEKYWGNTDRFNLLIYVAHVLDPRYKMVSLRFWLEQCKGDELADKIEAKVKLLLSRLIEQYSRFRVASGGSSIVAQRRPSTTSSSSSSSKFDMKLEKYLEQHGFMEFRSELDKYLSEERAGKSPSFDILDWWRVNAANYPILAEVARDVLATPISTVASESAFSTGGRILDPFRSSLSPESVEALICTQNWLRNKPVDIQELEEYIELIQLEDDYLVALSGIEAGMSQPSHSC